jgi:hypothetical protein
MRALKTLRIAAPALLALTTALACAGPAFGDAHVRQAASAHGSYLPQQSWPSRSAPDRRLLATVLGRRLDGDVVDRRTRPPIRTRAPAKLPVRRIALDAPAHVADTASRASGAPTSADTWG